MGPVSQPSHCSDSCGTLKNPHHCSKRVGDVDLGDVPTFLGLGVLSVRRDLNDTGTTSRSSFRCRTGYI